MKSRAVNEAERKNWGQVKAEGVERSEEPMVWSGESARDAEQTSPN